MTTICSRCPKGWQSIAGALALLLVSVSAAAAQEPPALESAKSKLSYALGMDLGQQLRRQSVEGDPAIFARGLGDGLGGGKTLMTEEEARAIITALQEELKHRAVARARLDRSAAKPAGKPSQQPEPTPSATE